ncbi:DUF2905 family protein [Oceanobacillus chungangensis]|uniref:DUF2905 domain-containing protein n=1 Tax=Oceanobacillus chungangensis TaxID=1229152 RepID=A0A3D8Q261_9BACI|nr:DUF2905 family protein [Oceanobacillus chungangensis]RDW21681.1 DUF2905 domain-containing protein [Oceanobacillus chungangensis]
MGKIFIIVGIIFLVIGLIWTFIGRLPGDFSFKVGNVSIHFPLMTSIIISIILTLIFTIITRYK